MKNDVPQPLRELFRRTGIIRARDVEPLGIPRYRLAQLVAQGVLYRSGRGLYGLAAKPVSEHHSLAEACKRVPHGVVCLLSALVLHGLTTQTPHHIWLAIDPKARKPKLDYPPLRIVRFSGPALTEGVERRWIEGVSIRVTSVEKTIADCFKYRNKLTTAVAVEALHDAKRQKKLDVDALWHMAKVCRVSRVILPYLETLP